MDSNNTFIFSDIRIGCHNDNIIITESDKEEIKKIEEYLDFIYGNIKVGKYNNECPSDIDFRFEL